MTFLQVNVDFYDNHHKKLLMNYPSNNEIEHLVRKPTKISKSEFLTYLLFTEQRESEGFRTFDELRKKVDSRLGYISDYLNIGEGTIKAIHTAKETPNEITERVGVSVSLCLVNKIHNMTEADWERIPIDNRKVLDFQIATTDSLYIFVESKGTILKNNNYRTELSGKAKHVKEKKDENKNIIKRGIAYGIITSIDQKNITQSWLLDPPAIDLPFSPKKYRLLSRMYFYWKNLKIISPKSEFLFSLINRIKVLEKQNDYEIFNSFPLFNSEGEEILVYDNYLGYSAHTYINNQLIIGRLIIYEDKIFFFGFSREVFFILAKQDFDEIINYNLLSKIEEVNIMAKINKNELNINSSIKQFIKHEEKKYYQIELKTDVYCTSSGRVFGFI